MDSATSRLALSALTSCRLCPRSCAVDRTAGDLGFCQTDAGFNVAAITLHYGEEPAISGEKGICNVFFGHCNLRCLYCQNRQISHHTSLVRGAGWTLEVILDRITAILDQGINRVGFVSPSHMVPQMVTLIRALHDHGYRPIVVYNSNGYDRVEILRELDDWVDVYLPDFKYSDPTLAQALSGAADYPERALAALLEMYRQRGSIVHLNDDGLAERGLIVRHLVLPGAVANSLGVLRLLAVHCSPKITLSLMSQYNPIDAVAA